MVRQGLSRAPQSTESLAFGVCDIDTFTAKIKSYLHIYL